MNTDKTLLNYSVSGNLTFTINKPINNLYLSLSSSTSPYRLFYKDRTKSEKNGENLTPFWQRTTSQAQRSELGTTVMYCLNCASHLQ